MGSHSLLLPCHHPANPGFQSLHAVTDDGCNGRPMAFWGARWDPSFGSPDWMNNLKTDQRPANTLRWRWRYRTPRDAAGPAVRAHGMLVTDRDADGDGFYEVRRIKGRRNGDRITGLYPAGRSIPGNEPYEGDNFLRASWGAGQQQLTKNGLQFKLDDGSFSNVFFASFLSPATYLGFHS